MKNSPRSTRATTPCSTVLTWLSDIQQTDENSKKIYADEAGEVRDGGINLYAKAWVEVTDENGAGEMLECIDTNNIVPIHLESLLKQADGEHVTISQGLEKNGNSTTVDVTLNNNSIVDSKTGNVVVWLYDANDNVVDIQQSYATEDDLITLMPEERKMMSFTFDKPGVRAEVSYGDLGWRATPRPSQTCCSAVWLPCPTS